MLVEDNESYDRRFDYIDSSDFSIVKYSSLNSVNKCGDILIETGFLLSDRVEGVDVFKNHINRANNIISAVNALKIKKLFLCQTPQFTEHSEKILLFPKRKNTFRF